MKGRVPTKDQRQTYRRIVNELTPPRPADMAFTNAELRGCVTKVRFSTKLAAKDACRKNGRTTKPYRCEFCGGWHNATKPNRKRSEQAPRGRA